MESSEGRRCTLHATPIPIDCVHCSRDCRDAQPVESSVEEPAASSKGGKAKKPLTKEPPAKDPVRGEPSSRVGESSKAKKPSAEIVPFNAALTAKIPDENLLPPPRDLPAVRVAYISKEIGLGLVAARDFAAGEFIFHERPLMEAIYNGHPEYARSDDCITSQYQAYDAVVRSSTELVRCFVAAFPKFAARMGLPFQLPENQLEAILNGGLARNMIHGRLGVSSATFEDYEQIWRELKPGGVSRAELRDSCHRFFKDYAFQHWNLYQQQRRGLDVAVTVPAYIYLLASLINHRCPPKDSTIAKLPKLFARLTRKTSGQNTAGTVPAAATGGAAPPPVADSASNTGPNCTFQINPNGLARFVHNKAIAVQAKRDIRQGEELTWDYGRKVGFKCLCRTCKR